MADRHSMTPRLPGPAAARQFLNQQAIPAAIDAAGALEAVLERVAQRARSAPVMALGLALGFGLLAAGLLRRR